MAFTPDSTVYLLDTPLDNTYKNQIYFEDRASQYAYFSAREKHRYNDLSFIRKDNVIKVPEHIDTLWNCNYVMYRNVDFGTKWFYAFITKMEYLSDKTTALYIETDVYQTWITEVLLKDSFVVREHVMDDSIGSNLIDEGLEYGEYKLKSYSKTNLLNDISFVIGVSQKMGDTNPTGNIYGNIYSGLSYIVFNSEQYGAMTEYLDSYVDGGKGDAIQFIFTIPTAFLNNALSGSEIPSGTTLTNLYYEFSSINKTLDGYYPKNNKLYTYPYNLLSVSNNQGGQATYRFEDFDQKYEPKFQISSAITPNPQIECIPQRYKGQSGSAYEYALTMGGYPFCSWANDMFSAWLAQNSTSVALGTVGSVVALGGGIATGNAMAIIGGALGVANEMAQIHKASIQPDQARGNINGGSLNIARHTQDFYFCHMTIKKEYAKRIDQYFSMFGYKINTVKVPNVNGRPYWNYVQTIDVNIDGAIPTEDMNRLKRMYNDGVTIWKKGNYVGNYSLDNSL